MKELRGAVIGYGFISGKGHIPAYLERKDVEIVAVADICEAPPQARAEASAARRRIYSDYKVAAGRGSRRTSTSSTSRTPPCDHAAIAHAAFDRGLHVLCEKPLTTTLEDAASLLKHAREAKRVLFPCHNYKHAPVVQAIREIIESGKIGKVRSLTLNTYRNTHAKGVTEWKTHWRREKKY